MDAIQSPLSRRSFFGTIAAGSLAGAGALALGNPFASTAFAAEAPASAPAAQTDAAAPVGIAPFATPYMTTEAERNANPKRVLVVVDYQVDFVDGGAFGRIEPAVALEDAIYDRVKEYQDAGDIVIYTMDTHPADHYALTREGQVNPEHCVPGTDGWQVYGRVRELLTPERAILVMKGTYGSPDLPYVVRTIQDQGTRIEYIEFAGVSTTCRVLHNAIMLFNFFPELPMVFDDTTTASYTDERTADQLDELEAWGFFVRRS